MTVTMQDYKEFLGNAEIGAGEPELETRSMSPAGLAGVLDGIRNDARLTSPQRQALLDAANRLQALHGLLNMIDGRENYYTPESK